MLTIASINDILNTFFENQLGVGFRASPFEGDTQMLTMSDIREADGKMIREVIKFAQLGKRYGKPLPSPLDAEGLAELVAMAHRWGFSYEEFRRYVKLLRYIDRLTLADFKTAKRIGSPDKMAVKLGIPEKERSEFCEYVLRKI